MDDQEEADFILPADGEIEADEKEEDPLMMDGFHEEGAEPETDF